MTVQVREKDSPAIGISGGEIVTVGGGSEGPKEYQVMSEALSLLTCPYTIHVYGSIVSQIPIESHQIKRM